MNKDFFMNYAEGQGAPTVKYEDKDVAEKEATRLAEKLGVQVITLKSVTAAEPKDITKRVKTYTDACSVLGVEPINEEVLAKLGFTKDEIAYRKIKTIAEALNEGWRPDWTDYNEYKYWPWFEFKSNSAGFAYACTDSAAATTTTSIGSRLCFKTRELATFAGKQFEDIYNDYLRRSPCLRGY